MLFRRPQIWTPFSDRCRTCGRTKRRRGLFDPLKLAAGDVMLDSSGNEILDASGNVLLDDGAGNGCCCGSNCLMCSGTASPTATLTLSGITICSGCVTDITGTSSFTASGTVSGTITLSLSVSFFGPPSNKNSCTYTGGPATPGITINQYGTTSCTSLVATTNQIYVATGQSAGVISLFVLADPTGFGNRAYFFYASGQAISNCTDTVTFTNGSSACGQHLIDGVAMGLGGSAVLSFP